MMPVTISILSSVLLAIMLWRMWKNTCLPEADLSYDIEVAAEEWASCPREFVSTVFSSDDWEFVSKCNSKPLKTLFMKERKSVARAWVRATAGAIHRIMRDHARVARRSKDLEIPTEVRVYLRYIALQAACAFLLLSIGLVGPMRLRDLSLRVYRLSERLSYAHWVLKTATETRELQGIWRT